MGKMGREKGEEGMGRLLTPGNKKWERKEEGEGAVRESETKGGKERRWRWGAI